MFNVQFFIHCKSLALQSLPGRRLDVNMKILYTSDIHASDTHLSSMLLVAEREDVDGIIIGGDIVPHNLPNSFGRRAA